MLHYVLFYLHNNLVAVDQLLNAIAGGDPDETISSRAGKQAKKGNRAAIVFCKVIGFVLGHDHCCESIEPDEGKDGLPL